jgi:sugar O-acyltransferase (sialic acid O-acetyltransferase NeuD family)
VVIIGAGGHGREVADILRDQCDAGTDLTPMGFIDQNLELHGKVIDGLPVLGDFSWFETERRDKVAVICAVGSPQICRRLVLQARKIGLIFASAISPRANISSRASLGEGVTIFPNVVVNTGAFVDSYSILNVGVVVSHDATVGSYCNINPGARLAGNTTINEGSYIGMGTSVIQGRTVGAWSVVGAGAVVISDLQKNVTAVGVPARTIKTREEGWHER